MPKKYEIGEILTPETAKEHIGKEVLVWIEVPEAAVLRRLMAIGSDRFWCFYPDAPIDENYYHTGAHPFNHAALPAKPKPKLWVGDPVVMIGGYTYGQISLAAFNVGWFEVGENCRLPTRPELEAAGYPAEQIEHLLNRWNVED